MAGHSRWAQIKHQKGAEDKKRGELFSKILSAIAAAARENPNPQTNPRLRSLIERAKDNKVPQDKIEDAVARVKEMSAREKEFVFEAYAEGGAALLIEAKTDSKNRALAEIKKILGAYGAKLGEEGSVRWNFELTKDGWVAKFTHKAEAEEKQKLDALIKELQTSPEVAHVYTNVL